MSLLSSTLIIYLERIGFYTFFWSCGSAACVLTRLSDEDAFLWFVTFKLPRQARNVAFNAFVFLGTIWLYNTYLDASFGALLYSETLGAFRVVGDFLLAKSSKELSSLTIFWSISFYFNSSESISLRLNLSSSWNLCFIFANFLPFNEAILVYNKSLAPILNDFRFFLI